MTEPIKQRVDVETNAPQVLAEASRAEQQYVEQVKQAGQAAQEAGAKERTRDDQLRDLRRRLTELVTAEQLHREAIAAGSQLTENDARESEHRQLAISRISGELRRHSDVQRQVNQLTAAAVEETQRAERVKRSYADHISNLNRRLAELGLQEARHQLAVSRGRELTDEERRSSERRTQQIERLKRVMVEQDAVQQRANQLMGRSEDAAGTLGRGMDRLRGQIASAAAAMIGTAGLQAALAEIRRDMEETARKAEELVQANLNLQFLSQTFNEQERSFVGQAAVFAGRSQGETARAYAEMKSRFPQLSDQEVQGLFMEAAESSRTSEGPMLSFVNALSTIRQFESDPQRAQNILRESITQAGVSDPSRLSPLFARTMGVLTEIAGLTPGEAAGTTAAATGLGLNPEEASTGLRNTVLAIAGKGTPEARAVLDQAGVRREAGFFGMLDQLSSALESGALAKEDLETIAGRENVGFVSLVTDRERLQRFVGSVRAVGRAADSPVDLTEQAIRNQAARDPRLATTMNLAQERARLELAQGEGPQAIEALEAELGGTVLERSMREQGFGSVNRWITRAMYNRGIEMGMSPERAAVFAEFGESQMTRDVAEGVGRARAGNVTINIQNIAQQYNNGPAPVDQGSGRDDLP